MDSVMPEMIVLQPPFIVKFLVKYEKI